MLYIERRSDSVGWVAGKARICVIAGPEQHDQGSMDALVKLGVRSWDTASNPLHVLQRPSGAASIVTVIENVPRNMAESEVLAALSVDKRLHGDFLICRQRRCLPVQRRNEDRRGERQAMQMLDDCIVVQSLEEAQVDWDSPLRKTKTDGLSNTIIAVILGDS